MNINLEEKITILYDFLYNNTLKKCYDINNINIKTIKIEDYLITGESDYEEDLVKKLFKQLISEQIQYFDEYNNNYFFKRFSDQYSTILKLSFNNHNDNDCLISYILSELVINNNTKHILLPIINFRIKVEDILKSNLAIEKMQEIQETSEYKNINENLEIERFLGSIDDPNDVCSIKNLEIRNNVGNIKSKIVKNVDDDNDYNPGF